MDSRTGAWGLDTSTPAWAQANRAPFLANQTWERDSFQHQGPGVFGRYLSGFDQGGIFDYAKKLQSENDAFFANQGGTAPGSGGAPSTHGGQWAKLDAMNGGFAKAAASTGVPANLIKAVLSVEGDWGNSWGDAPVVVGPGRVVNGFNGMMQATAQANGYDWNRIQTDQDYAIWTSADVLSRLNKAYGAQYGWEGVMKAYFSGNPNGVFSSGGTKDELGNDSNEYWQNVSGRWHDLDGGATSTNDVVNELQQYTGVPYVWGGVSQSSGWDCSGFTWAMDQKYGKGDLPQGSHQQLQYAQQHGKLFLDTNQLQPGDLIFWDTHHPDPSSGLNNASHVSIYLGNGKMIHAANESVGTIVSDFAAMQGSADFLGAMHQAYSGGQAGGVPGGPGGAGTGASSVIGGSSSASGPYWWNQPLDQLLKGAR